MTMQEELERAKQEQQSALRAAQQEQRRAKERQTEVSRAIFSQRKQEIDRWSPIVKALLDETARATWGEGGYTLIDPDPAFLSTWAAVRQQGKARLNYRVSLQISQPEPHDDSTTLPDRLVSPVVFDVIAAESFPAALREEALRQSLVEAFKIGPADGGLDQYFEKVLAKSPYKEGEWEPADWKIIAPGLIAIFVGLALLGSSDEGSILFGLALLALSITGLVISKFGQKFRRLYSWQKALVVIAVVPGVCAGGFIILGLIAILASLAGAAEKEKRVSEIEEGVRRALH